MNQNEALHQAGRGVAEALMAATREVNAGLTPVQRDALEPHDAHAGVGTPPLEAWEAATERHGWSGMAPPAAWGTLVLEAARVAHVVCAPGDYPQRLDVAALLRAPTARDDSTGVVAAGLLEPWVSRQTSPEAMVLAAGVLRVAGDRKAAMQLVESVRTSGENAIHLAVLKGALAFDEGDWDGAWECWGSLPQGPTRWHNMGLVAWLTGHPAKALFQQAADALDDRNPWHHLAALYADIATT